MLSSISPVGEHARRQRWSLTACAYLLGSVVGGAAMGGISGGLGHLLLVAAPSVLAERPGPGIETRLMALAGLCLLGVLADRGGWVPSRHRQVDERWLDRYRGWVYGGGYGLQLGTGVATIVPASVVWVLWGGVVLTADAGVGAALGALFGGARALPLLTAGGVRTVAGLRRALSWLQRRRQAASRVVSAGQVAVGVAAAAMLL